MPSKNTIRNWFVLVSATLFVSASSVAQPSSQSPVSPALPLRAAPQDAPLSNASPEDMAQYEAAFQLTFRKPADPAALAQFAAAAVKVGDIEGAISALERLLLLEADQPQVKLELGVLYFRLGSREAAMAYFDAARLSSKATKAVRERAETFARAAGR